MLCGGCRGDVGVTALLNRCVPCHDASAMLIVGLGKTNSLIFFSSPNFAQMDPVKAIQKHSYTEEDVVVCSTEIALGMNYDYMPANGMVSGISIASYS